MAGFGLFSYEEQNEDEAMLPGGNVSDRIMAGLYNLDAQRGNWPGAQRAAATMIGQWLQRRANR